MEPVHDEANRQLMNMENDLGFENNINRLRSEHYQSLEEAQKVVRQSNPHGSNNTKHTEQVMDEYDKQLVHAREALDAIANMQRKFTALIPVEELVSGGDTNNGHGKDNDIAGNDNANQCNMNYNNNSNDIKDDFSFDNTIAQNNSNISTGINSGNHSNDKFGNVYSTSSTSTDDDDEDEGNDKNIKNKFDYTTPQRPAASLGAAYSVPGFKYEHFNNSHRRLVENSYRPTPAVCNNLLRS